MEPGTAFGLPGLALLPLLGQFGPQPPGTVLPGVFLVVQFTREAIAAWQRTSAFRQIPDLCGH